ncbi:hypothetical protein D3C85_1402810 [compost metagenome]
MEIFGLAMPPACIVTILACRMDREKTSPTFIIKRVRKNTASIPNKVLSYGKDLCFWVDGKALS